MHDNNSYEIVIAMRPPGTAHCRRDGMMLKGASGQIVAHLREIPADRLGGLLDRIRGYNVVPTEYGFRWLASGLGYVLTELHSIKVIISGIYDRLEQLQQTVDSVIQRIDDQFMSEVEVVLERLEDAQKLPLDEARKKFSGESSFRMQVTLKTLKKRVEAAMAAVDKADPRRVKLLLQLVTVAGLEARVRLLSDASGRATEEFRAVRAMVDAEAERLLGIWLTDVDLLEVVDYNCLDDLLAEMQIIDGIAPMQRLKAAYAALPRVGDPQNGKIHYDLDTVDPNSGIPKVDLEKADLNYRYGARVFVRRGQAIGPARPGDQFRKAQQDIIKHDGFLLSPPYLERGHEFLYVRGTTPPIPNLAEHIRKLSSLVSEARAMEDGVAFAAEHPDAAHDFVKVSSGMKDVEGIELVVRATVPSIVVPIQRQAEAVAVPRLPKSDVG